MEKKRCSKCGRARPIDEFDRDKGRRDGRYPWCHRCRNAYTRDYRNRFTMEERRERRARWVANRNANTEARSKYLLGEIVYSLKKRYGITTDDVLKMADDQKGLCAICHTELRSCRVNVDHDHETGVIRGLLCSTCNSGLGFLKDDLGVLESALSYLRRHKR